MAKRKTFYVAAAVFEKGLSVHAIAVFAYLSFCADRQGNCFPSIKVIAERCGIVRNTVKKAIRELISCGLLTKESTHSISKNGLPRKGTDRYQLHTEPSRHDTRNCHGMTPEVSRDDRPYGHGMTPGRSRHGPEINNNDRDDTTDDVPSVRYQETDGQTELNAILDRLELDIFEDRVFAQAVEAAIRQMYFAPYLKVDGRRVPRDEVRARLSMLTIDHIDYVEKQIEERMEEIRNGDRYLSVCIYHAPVDCHLGSIRDRNALWL